MGQKSLTFKFPMAAMAAPNLLAGRVPLSLSSKTLKISHMSLIECLRPSPFDTCNRFDAEEEEESSVDKLFKSVAAAVAATGVKSKREGAAILGGAAFLKILRTVLC